MKPGSQKVARWESLIARVPKEMPKSEAEHILGPPSRSITTGEIEILSYRDEQVGDGLYSIRVAYTHNRVAYCYLGYEPCDGDCRNKRQKRSEQLQLFLVVVLTALGMLFYFWLQTR